MRVQVTGFVAEGKTTLLRIVQRALLSAGYTVQALDDEHVLEVGRGTFDQQPRYLVDQSDLLKLRDALSRSSDFHMRRDQMNAAGHLASETRYSPLTSTLMAAHDRVSAIIEGGTL